MENPELELISRDMNEGWGVKAHALVQGLSFRYVPPAEVELAVGRRAGELE